MRKSISTKTRFDIFKRDNFTCLYCGSVPPSVVLHIDHIVPVAKGGGNEKTNLATSCSSCNLGKGARPLTSYESDTSHKLEEIKEREKQLKGYYKLVEAQNKRIESECWRVFAVFMDCSPHDDMSVPTGWFRSVKMFVNKIGFYETLEAMEIAKSRTGADYQIFRYFCGVCWKKHKEASNASS